ncbi:hemerythrin [Marinicauda pacifica]|uniref:Hemerythrin domain-containing protein n=1 Tax=Marinicauda pacifica TaxID=1133559 RepID=A0A4S2HCN7_9PROT|nr:hemerythrin domain-containing protein [Marinicauda pacifica]TGY93815.1 hemerythrin domain-containing protein [Marinicauda pacifica]GGE30585.1 hemerythrin [Marinicauda pacifica]
MADIYEAITKDHDKARDLMKQIMDTTNRAAKKREELFETFKLDMWSHNKIEEALFYEPLRGAKETRGDAMEAVNEHHVAGGLLEELDVMPKDSEAWIGKFTVLKELLEHHMEEEENEIFSDARKVIAKDRAEELGDKFQSRKRVVVPALTPEA